MTHGNAWDEKHRGGKSKEKEIDIRVCKCGGVQLSFFGRTTLHLSHQEFIGLSRGVAEVSENLKKEDWEDALSSVQGSGLSH